MLVSCWLVSSAFSGLVHLTGQLTCVDTKTYDQQAVMDTWMAGHGQATVLCCRSRCSLVVSPSHCFMRQQVRANRHSNSWPSPQRSLEM